MIKFKNLKFKIKSSQLGFTLVELLIVVAIIGILSTLLTANFIGVRQRGRDAQRKSNLRQIQSALELYRSDQGGYPDATSSPFTCGAQFTSIDQKSIYMQTVPCDPAGGSYSYTQPNGNNTYRLIACLENQNDSETDVNKGSSNLAPCNGTTNFSYHLDNP